MLFRSPSSTQTFTVSGADLTHDVSIAASTNYQISKSAGSGYTTPLTFTIAELATPQTVYVRLVSGLSVGSYNSETITASSDGATNKTVTCSGSVTAPPPPNAPVATAASSITTSGFSANWGAVSGATSYRLDVTTEEEGGTATDLFFSEYIEGSSNHKYIEIYNGTGSSVDLSDYNLRLIPNGVAEGGNGYVNNNLSGTLANGECIVYKNSLAALTLPNGVTATTNTAVNFNGDDAIGLYKVSTASYVDIFGRIGEDPGTQWGSSPLWTINTTLVRKATVTSGVTVNPSSGFPTLATEWDMYSQDTSTYLGSHTFAGGSSSTYVSGYENLNVGDVVTYPVTDLNPSTVYNYVVRAVNANGTSDNSNQIEVTTSAGVTPPSTTVSVETLTGFTYMEDAGPSTEQNFTVSGANLTAAISITAPTNYQISTGTGGSFIATSPITLNPSSGTVSSTTIYVRLKAGLEPGNYNSESITVATDGISAKTVICSGSVTAGDAPDAPVATDATDVDDESFTANWGSVSGASSYRLDVYTGSASGGITDLFISEYIEGSGNNKAIEIYNGTGNPVDLTGDRKSVV